MKKAMILFAAGLLLISGCSNSSSGSSDVSSSEQKTDVNNSIVESTGGKKETDDSSVKDADSQFPETVIVDDEKCCMKVTGVKQHDLWGYALIVYIENKTSDQTLMYSWGNVAVNGVMCDPFWAKTLMPNTKSNEEVSFSDSAFEEYGIKDVTEITGDYRIYNEDDFRNDIAKGTFSVYPKGEEAAEQSRNEKNTDVKGEVLFDTDKCKMIVTGYDPDNIWGYTAKIYLENKTDKTLMFSVTDSAVNGFSCEPLFSTEVAAKKTAFKEINWSSSDFKKNNITDVQEIVLKIRVYDPDDWGADAFVDQSITLHP